MNNYKSEVKNRPRPMMDARKIDAMVSLASEELASLLALMFTQLEKTLAKKMQMAATNNEHNLLVEAIREIHLKQINVERKWLDRVNRHVRLLSEGRKVLFNRQEAMFSEGIKHWNLSVMGDDEMKEESLIVSAVAKGRSAYSRQLLDLTNSLSQLFNLSLQPEHNCFNPQFLTDAFYLACLDLDVNSTIKAELLQSFSEYVLQNMGDVVKAMVELLRQQGIEPDRYSRRSIYDPDLLESNLSDNHSHPVPDNDSGSQGVGHLGRYGGAYEPGFEPESRGSAHSPFLKMMESVISQAEKAVDHAQSFIETPNGLVANQIDQITKGVDGRRRLSPEALYRTLSVGNGPTNIIPRQQLFTLLNDMQQQQVNVSIANLSVQDVPRLDVFEALEAAIAENLPEAENHTVKPVDNNIINIISMLFDFILDDPDLPFAVKASIARLQIPLLKLALQDASLFENIHHPARQLLNKMAMAGGEIDDRQPIENDPVFVKIDALVQRVLVEVNVSTGFYAEQLERFRSFLETIEKRTTAVEKRAQEAAVGQLTLDALKVEVSELVQHKLEAFPYEAPQFLVDFIKDDWARFLVRIGLRRGVDQNLWTIAVKMVDLLLWSAEPVLAIKQKERWSKSLPSIIKNIKKAFAEIAMEPEKALEFLKQLEDQHKYVANSFAQPQASLSASKRKVKVSAAESVASEALKVKKTAKQEACFSSDGETTSASAAQSVAEQSVADNAAAIDWAEAEVSGLNVGDWLRFSPASSEHSFVCKLSLKIDEMKTFVFVNNRGQKVLHQTFDQLVHEMMHNRLVVVERKPIFERAVGAVKELLANMVQKENDPVSVT